MVNRNQLILTLHIANSPIQCRIVKFHLIAPSQHTLQFMLRIKTSNCISRILWFGSDAVGIQKMR